MMRPSPVSAVSRRDHLGALLNGDWTFALAEREWFWGYTWEGVKPKDTYFEWMSIVRDAGLRKAAARRQERRRLHRANASRAAGRGPGSGQLAEEGVPEAGRRDGGGLRRRACQGTLRAGGAGARRRRHSRRARRSTRCTADLDALDKSENAAATADGLPRSRTAATARLEQHRLGLSPRGVSTRSSRTRTSRRSTSSPTTFRSGSASAVLRFSWPSSVVLRTAFARVRVSLADEMRLDATSLQGFPIALFTLSLEKIAHILDGALAPAATPVQRNPSGERARHAAAEPARPEGRRRDRAAGEPRARGGHRPLDVG